MTVSDADAPPKVSSHVSDPLLQPLLQPSFDPADYLNSTLPTLAIGSQGTAGRNTSLAKTGSLADVSSHAQTLLSQLNAQISRLSTVLTQLTDDIIRSGSRLAYEVDLLRGESLNLSELVDDKLKTHIQLFTSTGSTDQATKDAEEQTEPSDQSEPQYISQLRVLTKVRQRLDGVIKIFGEAMKWTLPPSDISIASSFITVSAPDPGSDSQSREQKGKEFAERLRTEIADLVLNAEDPKTGLAAAQARIDALRDLAQVWKGTAEEKARIRFVDNLTKLAEERLRELERGGRFATNKTSSPRKSTGSTRAGSREDKEVGFLENLYRLKNCE
ncbi:uncharacterized protein PV09_04745 [Verruconis gallopava]|uniref:Uncharacterized protein n=1 Tax=Verruconis gallopava TaxID=253628 RepID=A0A0D1YTC9_9PEZI|nr:uncharacterized protein PV09_04745 [Verruconis gallopava]KIW03902.1 hypothetical protein PV09_04745 [Verruconis gallopava]